MILRLPWQISSCRDRYSRLVPQNLIIWNVGTLTASYGINRFHYIISPPENPSPPTNPLYERSTYLHFRRYVGLAWTAYFTNLITTFLCLNHKISRLAKDIVNGCPNLRTFTLHLLTSFDNIRNYLEYAFPQIAPSGEWLINRHRFAEWSPISIDGRQKEGIKRREDDHEG